MLRPRREAEASVYRRLWTQRDVRVPPHRRVDAAGRPTLEDVTLQIRAESTDAGTALLAVERKDLGDVIGYCGLVTGDQLPSSEPELAFELLRAAHNRGYATEAASAVVEWARDEGFTRLWASVWDWNAPSRRVLEKLGFRDSGLAGRTSEHGRTLMMVLDL